MIGTEQYPHVVRDAVGLEYETMIDAQGNPVLEHLNRIMGRDCSKLLEHAVQIGLFDQLCVVLDRARRTLARYERQSR